ncbi:hypothetical protein GY12_12855 [Micrococcus luteus]|nr:hypothetical protein GY12_12855 [Micrococcus luteus]
MVAARAARTSGISRCGSTDVYSEPGPSTTQSASSIAESASGVAGGVGRAQADVGDAPLERGDREGHLALHASGAQAAVRAGAEHVPADGQRHP